jgi:hypothetical protein
MSWVYASWFSFMSLGLAIWGVFWKGKALWKAAKNNQLYWFIALLVVNSVGILPIIYIVFFSKDRKKK